MKLTTKGRYAVMAMADLAMFKDKGKELASEIQKYLKEKTALI